MSAFHVLLRYIPAALRAERGPLPLEQLPGRLDAGPVKAAGPEYPASPSGDPLRAGHVSESG
ncbi:hypothetical protein [Deinococcus soli (ex Cha et al. 2016)]|uniref:Uncharacterized protein n=1 Tax=Deinococcus soli (ex Cha et al. 2016) TaxID=1309411 RepID=A0ACC6KMK2_9DEIO|nr:hypothetical protein [Deinococcus soli (ex Cha et al. 2016)]MDR6330942.1 hypothetical protein [Deinococcus soli (ex Cha et al. 2016)]MDR6753671.1 hypothetical protein [Deinococcus soli (ex Cha et al. 2016)]